MNKYKDNRENIISNNQKKIIKRRKAERGDIKETKGNTVASGECWPLTLFLRHLYYKPCSQNYARTLFILPPVPSKNACESKYDNKANRNLIASYNNYEIT